MANPTTKPIKKIKLSHKIPLLRLRALGYRIIFHVRNNTVIILAVIPRSRLEAAITKVITRVMKGLPVIRRKNRDTVIAVEKNRLYWKEHILKVDSTKKTNRITQEGDWINFSSAD